MPDAREHAANVHARAGPAPRELGASPSPALQRAAQHAQPLEPILFPKLRIYFADFPYLLCSIN